MPPVPVGDEITVQSYDEATETAPSPAGWVPFSKVALDPPKVGGSLSWNPSDPTKVVFEKAGAFDLMCGLVSTAYAKANSCVLSPIISAHPDLDLQIRGSMFPKLGASVRSNCSRITVPAGSFVRALGYVFDETGTIIDDPNTWMLTMRVVRVG